MIKFRGQRVDNGGIVEGHYTGGMATVYRHVIISTIDNCVYQINFDTLQVLTTDGWADIADVEVVRKNPAVGNHALRFAEWLQENRWFSFENGKWNYSFEHGTSISEASYNKNYRKTTQELYAKFCKEQGELLVAEPTTPDKQ